jgi:hypothetical protein
MKKVFIVLAIVGFVACTSNQTTSTSTCDSTKCDSTQCKDSLDLNDSISVRQVVEMDKHPERY